MIPPAQIGSYRIERLLGTGSFATVWLGYDPSLGARVAIKVLAENWSHDLRVRERFLDEARLLWRLDHDRVVRIYSLAELPDGRPYLVMVWADRGSLRDRLAAGPIPVGPGLRLLREISAGVAVLHDNGIVHRDLTPGNVLFRSRPDGPAEQVVIADLGLAKALAAASGLTARAGTPGYMAPEQDDPLAIVDTRADVYSLGRLGGTLLGVAVPPRVAGVLRTATAHRPADRYPDAAAFAAALERATRRHVPRHRRAMVVAGFLTAAAVLAALGADSAPDIGVYRAGQIAVALPEGWHAGGSVWNQRGRGGERQPALEMSPARDRWKSDPAVPGAFVGLSRGIAAQATTRSYVAKEAHPGCVAAPVRFTRQAGIDWMVARYTACPTGKAVIVETVGSAPGGAGLVYVQIAPPTGSGPEFVDTLLAGVRVR